ncbi:RNA methyltransferase [Candidatus Saccharibacteria bacterium]|nr:RNA methyltransferase [Candidatus Saccharibacteria bacterium]
MIKNEVGVGPHSKPWPIDPKFDKELLENGDRRNVLDKYRYWTVEAIKADLDTTRVRLHIAVENWQHDLNIGTMVRTANAFNVEAVHIIGKKHWNRRGAMVTDRYLNIYQYPTVDEFVVAMKHLDKQIIAVDNIAGSLPLSSVKLPKNSVLVFGGEGPGISTEMQKHSKNIIAIEQFGSTRSINVGVAAGIAMYIWVKMHATNICK